MNDKNITISTDRNNPTWVWVGSTEEECKAKKYKRILLSIHDQGCDHVLDGYENNYQEYLDYVGLTSKYFEFVKPEYRAFETADEIFEAVKVKGWKVFSKNRFSEYSLYVAGTNVILPYKNFVKNTATEAISFIEAFKQIEWPDGTPFGKEV